MIKYAGRSTSGDVMTLSDATRERVILKYLVATPIPQIASEEKIGESTVYTIMDDFYRTTFGRGSTKIRLLVEAMKRSKLSVAHHAVAERLLHLLLKFVEVDELGEPPDASRLQKATTLFEKWLIMCSSGLINPQEALHIINELQDVCASLGLASPKDLRTAVEDLRDEAHALTDKITSGRSEIEKIKQDTAKIARARDEELRKSGVVYENLEPYATTRARIAENVKGGDPDKYFLNIAEIIESMKAAGLDLSATIPMLKRREQMLEDEKREQEEHMERFEMRKRLESMHQAFLDAKGEEVAFVRRLEFLGIDSTAGNKLLDNLEKAATVNGCPPASVVGSLSAALGEFVDRTTEVKRGVNISTDTAENRRGRDNKETTVESSLLPITPPPAGEAAAVTERAAGSVTVAKGERVEQQEPTSMMTANADTTTNTSTIKFFTNTNGDQQHVKLDDEPTAIMDVGRPTDNPYSTGLQPSPGEIVEVEETTIIRGTSSGCSCYSTGSSNACQESERQASAQQKDPYSE